MVGFIEKLKCCDELCCDTMEGGNSKPRSAAKVPTQVPTTAASAGNNEPAPKTVDETDSESKVLDDDEV